MSRVVLRATGTANPRRNGTKQEFCDWPVSRLSPTPREHCLYGRVLLEGPIKQIDWWAVHPGGTRVLEQIGEKLVTCCVCPAGREAYG